jgi:hypothetical protein
MPAENFRRGGEEVSFSLLVIGPRFSRFPRRSLLAIVQRSMSVRT